MDDDHINAQIVEEFSFLDNLVDNIEAEEDDGEGEDAGDDDKQPTQAFHHDLSLVDDGNRLILADEDKNVETDIVRDFKMKCERHRLKSTRDQVSTILEDSLSLILGRV